MHLPVIYQDDQIVVLNKPAGLLVHPVSGRSESTLVDWLLKQYPSVRTVGDNPGLRPGLVHRLDRDTSGIILVTLSQPAFNYFKNLFQIHAITKTYLAVVRGLPSWPSGRINLPIGIKSGTTRRSVHSAKLSKAAITDYRLLGSFAKDDRDYSLLSVSPLTGRTHQIRVHLAHFNHSVVGDALYSKHPEWPRLLLHSFSLEFQHLNGTRLKLTAEPPADFLDFSPSLAALVKSIQG